MSPRRIRLPVFAAGAWAAAWSEASASPVTTTAADNAMVSVLRIAISYSTIVSWDALERPVFARASVRERADFSAAESTRFTESRDLKMRLSAISDRFAADAESGGHRRLLLFGHAEADEPADAAWGRDDLPLGNAGRLRGVERAGCSVSHLGHA